MNALKINKNSENQVYKSKIIKNLFLLFIRLELMKKKTQLKYEFMLFLFRNKVYYFV